MEAGQQEGVDMPADCWPSHRRESSLTGVRPHPLRRPHLLGPGSSPFTWTLQEARPQDRQAP